MNDLLFSNPEIDPAQIPRAEAVEFRPIGRDYLRSLRLTWAIQFTLLAVLITALIYFIPALRLPWVIALSAGLYCLLLATTVGFGTLSFRHRAFAVRTHDILYRSGWFTKTLHAVPFNRLQHAVIHRGPIDRKFGLASLTLHTAAFGSEDLTIHGLKQQEAEDLRAFIIEKIKPLQDVTGLV